MNYASLIMNYAFCIMHYELSFVHHVLSVLIRSEYLMELLIVPHEEGKHANDCHHDTDEITYGRCQAQGHLADAQETCAYCRHKHRW